MAKRRGRGEGSIEQLPSGSWRAIVSLGTDPQTGKRIKRSATYDTKREALEWRDQQNVLFAAGKLRPNAVTLAEYASRWMELGKLRWKDSYVDYLERVLDRLIRPHLGGVRLADLTKHRLETWLANLNAPLGQKRRAVTTLRSVLKAALDDGLVRENAARRITRPKVQQKEMKHWTAEQARAVVAEASRPKRRLGAMFVLFLDTGARVGELLGLHWPEVDLEVGTVRIVRTLDERNGQYTLTPPKTQKARRTVRLSPVAIEALTRHRRAMKKEKRDVDSGPVFVAAGGGYVPRWTFARHYFRKLVKAAGAPIIRPHDMRHTNATLLLAAGVNIKTVSERLGHEDIVTTLRLYAHVLVEHQDQAAAAIGTVLQNNSPTTGTKPAQKRDSKPNVK